MLLNYPFKKYLRPLSVINNPIKCPQLELCLKLNYSPTFKFIFRRNELIISVVYKRFSEKNAHYSKRSGITTTSSSSSKKIAVAAAAASSSSTASNSSISISSSATTTRTSSIDDEMSLRHPQTTMSSLSSTTIELSAEMLSSKKRANKNETVIKEVPSKGGEVETSKRIFQNLNSHHVTNTASYKLGSRVGELSSLVEQNAAESSIEITKYIRISSPKKTTG